MLVHSTSECVCRIARWERQTAEEGGRETGEGGRGRERGGERETGEGKGREWESEGEGEREKERGRTDRQTDR